MFPGLWAACLVLVLPVAGSTSDIPKALPERAVIRKAKVTVSAMGTTRDVAGPKKSGIVRKVVGPGGGLSEDDATKENSLEGIAVALHPLERRERRVDGVVDVVHTADVPPNRSQRQAAKQNNRGGMDVADKNKVRGAVVRTVVEPEGGFSDHQTTKQKSLEGIAVALHPLERSERRVDTAVDMVNTEKAPPSHPEVVEPELGYSSRQATQPKRVALHPVVRVDARGDVVNTEKASPDVRHATKQNSHADVDVAGKHKLHGAVVRTVVEAAGGFSQHQATKRELHGPIIRKVNESVGGLGTL